MDKWLNHRDKNAENCAKFLYCNKSVEKIVKQLDRYNSVENCPKHLYREENVDHSTEQLNDEKIRLKKLWK